MSKKKSSIKQKARCGVPHVCEYCDNAYKYRQKLFCFYGPWWKLVLSEWQVSKQDTCKKWIMSSRYPRTK